MTDGAGTVGYGYDNSDRLTSVTRGGSGFTYSYDSAGRLAARTYPDGSTTSYGYDDDSRLSTVTVGSGTTGYTYDAAGRLTATAYPNGWSEQRSYDAADRLTDIKSVNGQNTLAHAAYTRDAVGNPTTIVRDSATESYSYDSADRVTGACYGGPIATCPTGSLITYAYDKVGNRTSQTKFGTTTTYSYDAADELTSSTSGGNTTAYTYDNDGQQTGEGSRTFSYDLAGHLTSVADNGVTTASFTYDGNGNRLTKTAGSTTTTYWWDENNDLPMLSLEQQGGSTLRSYQYGNSLISMISGGSSYYFHHDNVDSTAAVTKGDGNTEWTYTYTPYGEARQITKVDPNAPGNPLQYAGQLLDSETGLYDLRARVYGPADGRFLSIDPVPEDTGDPAVGNYLYAADDPLLLSDPSGQHPVFDDDSGDTQWAHPCPHGGWWFNDQSECQMAGNAVPPSSSGGEGAGNGNHGGESHSGLIRVASMGTSILTSIATIRPVAEVAPCGTDLLSCGPEEFINMAWEQRISWIQAIEKKYELGGWLDIFKSTLAYLKSSSTFSGSERMHAADGWVLWAVSIGLASAKGVRPAGTGGPWETFFKTYFRSFSNPPVDILKRLWGKAEQTGVDFATRMTEYIPESDEESFVYDAFKWAGDQSRYHLIHGGPLAGGFKLDPRKDGAAVQRDAVCVEHAAKKTFRASKTWNPFASLGAGLAWVKCGLP